MNVKALTASGVVASTPGKLLGFSCAPTATIAFSLRNGNGAAAEPIALASGATTFGPIMPPDSDNPIPFSALYFNLDTGTGTVVVYYDLD